MHTAALRGSCALLTLLLAASPGLAAAGGAFLVKGGALRLADDRQSLDFVPRDLETDSHNTVAFAVEARKRSGVALGAEFITYRNDFTSPATVDGNTRTRALQFVGKKYFIEGGPFHPYFGAGVGLGYAQYSYQNGGTEFSDDEFTFVLQALGGIELRFDNLAFTFEAKYLNHDIESGGNEFNPSATGLFAGVGFIW